MAWRALFEGRVAEVLRKMAGHVSVPFSALAPSGSHKSAPGCFVGWSQICPDMFYSEGGSQNFRLGCPGPSCRLLLVCRSPLSFCICPGFSNTILRSSTAPCVPHRLWISLTFLLGRSIFPLCCSGWSVELCFFQPLSSCCACGDFVDSVG